MYLLELDVFLCICVCYGHSHLCLYDKDKPSYKFTYIFEVPWDNMLVCVQVHAFSVYLPFYFSTVCTVSCLYKKSRL